jgi:hypothetical protein
MISLKTVFRHFDTKKTWLYVGAGLVLLLIIFFIFRNSILHSVLEKKCAAFKEKYHAELKISEARFSGLTGITLENISLLPAESDTLLKCGKAYVHIRLFPLFIGKVKIDEVQLVNTLISFRRHKGKDNYNFLLQSHKEKNADTTEVNSSYSDRIHKICKGIFTAIPDDIEIQNLKVEASLDSNTFSLDLPEFTIEKQGFLSSVGIKDNGKQSFCFLQGEIDKDKNLLNFKIYADSGEKVQLPYLNVRFGLHVDFDTLRVGFSAEGSPALFTVNGNAMVAGLLVNHKRIAETDVVFQKLGLTFRVNATDDYLELDSTSTLVYNRFELNPYIRFSQKPRLKAHLKIENEFVAQDLFESLPTGMFHNFDGMKTQGKLKLYVNFDLDMQQPDSLKFDATLSGKDFSVISYGVTDFRKIAGTFSYTAYEHGIAARTFEVGPENPMYTPLEAISPYLKDAVLISENGGYYYSSGFNVDAFRQSIIDNIHAGRFVRGGSTIDMQLVKNVFLSRNKNITRKAEEILIAWLINNNNLCTKEKMYEDYLNLIEWGPGIYGISEASHYYFSKRPAQLTMAESIYLASIIPKPRWFKSSFDPNGMLSARNQIYFSLIAGKLIAKGSATPADSNDMLRKVILKGPAKLFMAKDTMHFVMDSVMMEEN